MFKVITKIVDPKNKVFLKKEHLFRSKYKMEKYKETLIKTIDDDEVKVSFSTYIKQR